MDIETTVHAYAFQASAKAEQAQIAIISSAQLQFLKVSLKQYVPQSLVLLRRLHLFPTTPDSLILSSFQLSENSSPWPRTFCLAFVDRSGAPAVEAWLLTHLETTPDTRTRQGQQIAAQHMLSFMQSLAASPFSITNSALDDSVIDNASHLLLGAVSEHLRTAMLDHPPLAHMMRDDLYSPGGPFAKMVFPTNNMQQQLNQATLPDGLVWDTVGEADLPVVIASNAIIKTAAMARCLPSACIRLAQSGRMVAWAFVGPDGCVRSLFCVPEWRGRGLARLIVLKLHLQAPLSQAEDASGHADAADSNTGSMAIFKSLEAERVGAFYWMRLDLERLIH